MSAKITLIIGDYIENLDVATLAGFDSVELFPELGRNHLASGHGFPCHATRAVSNAREFFLDATVTKDAPNVAVLTHSSYGINSVGIMISDGDLVPSDVIVWMFKGTAPTGPTPDATYSFTDEGAMQNGWPFGWFEPD